MSLSLKISAEESKDSILINDCTGSYSYENKTGYGIPNLRIEDATDAYFEITTPEGDGPFMINVFSSFPTPNKEISFEILPYMIGMKEIDSGEYKIKYIVTFKDKKGGVYTQMASYSLFCTRSVICCVDKMIRLVRAGGSKDVKQQNIIKINNLLQGVLYQVECGNYRLANQDLKYIKSQCECCGCK